MRPLGGTTIEDATVNGMGYKTHQSITMSRLLEFWNQWEIQLMVLTSFVLQLFLLLTGHLRRRKISGPLRVSIWLAYVGADLVAVFALGLFSQYEKYILGREESFGDTSVFLWVPFLLVHLGGQDSITAFSIEDNNLWLRHLLNLGIQGTLALYVFWKSIHRLNSQVLFPAPFVFVYGIIKYGERTWALRTGSRDGLWKSSFKRKKRRQQGSHSQEEEIHSNGSGGVCCISSRARASYALQTVHLTQGLFAGRTMLQLGDGAKENFEKYFIKTDRDRVGVEEKIRITVMELGMMFDLLYTKAMVLQSKTGCLFRCAAQVSMVAAFVLFVVQDNHNAHKHSSSIRSRVDAAITYTLFVGAILMEACSVATVIASPWTRAHVDDSRRFLGWLYSSSSKAFSFFRAMKAIVVRRCRNMLRLPSCQQRPSTSYTIGQYNHVDFFAGAPIPKIICKVISAVGVGKLWLVKRVEAQRLVDYVVRWFDGSPEEYFSSSRLKLGRRLNYTLCLPFEHALYRLQIYMDLHISRHFDGSHHADDVWHLREDCEKLSNYMAYLTEVYPSMLPVSTRGTGGGLPSRSRSNRVPDSRRGILEWQEKAMFNGSEPDSASPFEPPVPPGNDDHSDFLKGSLEEIREMWMRLLVYAAGKCGGELHARQLGNGCELLTIVWLLMLHHGLGDAATEVNLLTSDDPSLAELGSIVAAEGSNWVRRPEQPRYAFDFSSSPPPADQAAASSRQSERQQQQLAVIAGMLQQVMAEAEQQSVADGTTLIIRCVIQRSPPGGRGSLLGNHETGGTSGEAGRDDAAISSSSEIIEEQDAAPGHG